MALVELNSIKDIHTVFDQKERAIAIGNFDGFHLGHRKIVGSLIEISKKMGIQSDILTFYPHPRKFFKKNLYLIHNENQKRVVLESQKVDDVFFLKFDEITQMSGETFVKEILIDALNMKAIVVGRNFKFGRSRGHTTEDLRKLSDKYDFHLAVVKPVLIKKVRISSSLIRKKLINSSIEEANLMLGYEFYLDGIVVEGEKMGRELGFPTININSRNEILPKGVFKTRVNIDDGIYPSITNIGERPTFSGETTKIETHILNFDKKVYGKKVRLFFEKKIRNEKKFNSKSELIAQIKSDIIGLNIDKNLIF